MSDSIIDRIRRELLSLADDEYKAFSASLIPTVAPESIIGIRTPVLRKAARKYSREAEVKDFLRDLPHRYFEENNLHAFITESIADYGECISEIDRLLPYIDNWATCDSMRPRCFARHHGELICDIRRWIRSSHTYTVRFGLEMLMLHFLDGDFDPDFLKEAAVVTSSEYYVNMMISWYFATAIAKQPRDAVKYLEEHRLPEWVHNKTIQKAVESYRVSGDMKAYLKKLRLK